MRYLFLVIMIISLAACSEEKPDPGDPVTIARDGLVAFYSGDLDGVSENYCSEIVLDMKRKATENGAGNGYVEFGTARFEEAPQQSSENWTYVRLSGRYAVWLYGGSEIRDTEALGGDAIIYLKLERDKWKICDFGSEVTPVPTVAP